ncbi:unnamed protein product [Mytilus edulis]|uniref:SGNH hydrolase-type esterase domain-containing protein n=1 Tax=Mytilus edulis TaxID=6550 RepID=A0A8S3SRI8_MYTED|nr:unnamed protein product [Mytilus edulis]
MNEKFSEITKLKSDVEKLEKVVQNLNTNINSETMSTVARQLAWLGENIKMDLDRCENSQKIYQDSLVVLNRIEVTHKLLAQTANAVNMNRVVEELRVNQAETRETNKKIDKIDSDLRKNQMCKSHDTPVSHNDQSQDFRDDRNDESEIDHNKLENSQEKGESVRSTQNSTNENTPKANLWIIGSSIVKDLNGRRIYRNKNTRINTLRDKTVFGATQFIKLEKVSAENVLFQIGSNDLERKQADCVLKEVEYLVATTRRILPATKIILAEILPRFLRDRDQSKEFEEKRRQYNTLLKDYCFDENIQLVEYSNMRTTDYIDGIHLNEVGVGIMVKCIKKITNPLLGIVTDTKQRSPDNQYRNQNYRNRPYQNTADNVGIKSDINILLETWKGECKEYNIPGFNTFSKIRKKKKKAKRHSGGILVYYKKIYSKGISHIQEGTNSQNRLWLKLDKNFFGLTHDLYLCAVYIPPVNSTHYENDYTQLEKEISTYSNKGQIALIGDFNSRTSSHPDFIENDDPDLFNIHSQNILPQNYDVDQFLKRNNQDKILNAQGNNLLELCLSSRLRILNGRYIGDSLGYFTCFTPNGLSTVDYAIVSKSLLTSVIYFKTNEINYLSDHAQIEIFLKCNISEKQSLFPEDKWKTMKSYKWNDNSKNILIQTLSSENFINEIINFESKKYSENQNGIDQAASELDLILCNLTEKSCTLRHKTMAAVEEGKTINKRRTDVLPQGTKASE